MTYSKGPWISTFTLRKERGVRNEGGFICFLPKPTHYSGQDQRYEDELAEKMYDAKLIAAAPDMLEALQSIVDYWNTPQKGSMNDHIEHSLKLAEKAIKKATE